MNRRDFLRLSMLAAGSASLGSGCANLTSRYTPPQKLTNINEKLLLKNCNIVDTVNGKLKTERNLLVKDGVIVGIIHDNLLSNTTPDRIIDIKNQFVMPGIINGHCHISMPGGLGYNPGFLQALKRQAERNAEECIKHGVTTVRDMLSIFDWTGKLKDKISKGTIIGPDIISSCAFACDNSYFKQIGWLSSNKFWKEINTPNDAKKGFEEFLDENRDFIKILIQRTDLYLPGKPTSVLDNPTIKTICDAANRKGITVAAHHTDFKGLQDSIKGGVSSFEHMASDKLVTEKEIEALISNGSYFVPTVSVPFGLAFKQIGDQNWGKGELPKIIGIREQLISQVFNEYLEPEIAKSSYALHMKMKNPLVFKKRHLLPFVDPTVLTALGNIGAQNTKILYKAGVNFGCGNDGGVPFIHPGAMGLEMFLLEKYGFKTEDILKMATINNARLLKRESRIGSIDLNKDADIAIFKNNPLDTTWNLLYPSMVFKKGKLLFNSKA